MRTYYRRYSVYKGVTWDREKLRWMAFAKVRGKQTTIGRFLTEREAHEAYQKFVERDRSRKSL